MSVLTKRGLLAALAVAGALTLVAADHAEARRGGSIGSRGTRTFQAPAATPTAPGAAAPIQRSTTSQTAPQPAPSAAQRPQAAARPSLFGGGLGGALMRGLLIGGLVGLLFGQGLGGIAGVLGLLLQVGLLVAVVMLVLRFMRGSQPVPAGAGRGPVPPRPADWRGGGMAAPRAAPPRQRDEIGVAPSDLDTFERLLGTVQSAFSREDQAALRADTTPEMFGYLADELRANAERGLRNEVTDVKLLQGDVAEAWREGDTDYATVAMRYAARDVMVDRTNGRVLSGDLSGVGESTEVWTFVRSRSGPEAGRWRLSAIQGA